MLDKRLTEQMASHNWTNQFTFWYTKYWIQLYTRIWSITYVDRQGLFANNFFFPRKENKQAHYFIASICMYKIQNRKEKSIYESYYLSHTQLLLPGACYTLVTVYVVYLPRGELQRKATLSHLFMLMKTSWLLALTLVFKFNLFWFLSGSVSVLSH